MDSRVALLIAVARMHEDIRATADARAGGSIDAASLGAQGRRRLRVRRSGHGARPAAIVRR